MATRFRLAHFGLGFGQQQLIGDCNLCLAPGELLWLKGGSGCGKSSLLRAVMGLEDAARLEGDILLEERSVVRLSTEKRVQLGMALIPEVRPLFPELSIAEHLKLGAIARSDRQAVFADRQQWLDYFPVLAQRMTQPAATLSGGEQNLLSLAMVLMQRPRLLLWDEPLRGLSPVWIQNIFRIIPLLKQEGIAMILAGQSVEQLQAHVDQTFSLRND